MQKLVEPPRVTKQRSQFIAVMVCVIFAAWVAIFVLPYWDDNPAPIERQTTAPPATAAADGDASLAHDATTAAVHNEVRSGRDTKRQLIASPKSHGADILDPWGYNAHRNVMRWKAIKASIAKDGRDKFTLLDYGADQGYFSVSVGHAFPGASVVAVELGGKGGEIWAKQGKDVHVVQEQQMQKFNVNNVMTCQTKVGTDQFGALNAAKQMHTYQLVLSVFHWFPLDSRAAFEKVVTDLFTNARTTFIELPTIGDGSKLIRDQKGYAYWSKWYDGRTDIKEVLESALASQKIRGTVELVVATPWLKWTRDVYRVDILSEEGSNEDYFAHRSFSCAEHRRILRCGARELHQQCAHETS